MQLTRPLVLAAHLLASLTAAVDPQPAAGGAGSAAQSSNTCVYEHKTMRYSYDLALGLEQKWDVADIKEGLPAACKLTSSWKEEKPPGRLGEFKGIWKIHFTAPGTCKPKMVEKAIEGFLKTTVPCVDGSAGGAA